MRKLVLATRNRHKVEEMGEALRGLDWNVVAALVYPDAPEVVEDGATLEENSLKKARALLEFTGEASMADDTGLFVDALGGEPGVFAARFAGEGCTYEDNVRKLLKVMEKVPAGKRSASFRTVITICRPDGRVQRAVGEVKGTITGEARGQKGFGYDPVFLPDGQTKVFAEMSLEEKNRISHRGLAVMKAREILKAE